MGVGRFPRFAWGALVYNVLVILWGAYVRATGSGAGCGRHWPLCNGEVVPLAPGLEQSIEFTHRVMSGLSLVVAVILLIWAYRAYPSGHRVRLGATLVLLFVLVEALVGAGLVLFGLVADNSSLARAVVIAIHLANTFLLLGSLALTAIWSSGVGPLNLHGRGGISWLVGLGLLGVMLVGATGAITALGDTLFPSASLAEGVRQDFAATTPFLLRLRVYHPVFAVTVGTYVVLLSRYLVSVHGRPGIGRLQQGLSIVVIAQLLAGAFNVALMAPVWMQAFHLLLADLLWITLILFAGVLFAGPRSDPRV